MVRSYSFGHLDLAKWITLISILLFSFSDHTYQDNVNITGLYFSMLSNEDILELHQIYKHDFDMFGYSFLFRNITIHPET